VTTLAVSELSLPAERVSLLGHLSRHGVHSAAVGAVLEHQLACLDELTPSSESAAVSAKVIEDALEVYEPDEYPVRRVRLLARAVQQSCFQPASGSPRHVSVEREVNTLCERQAST
jgi:hypothetical protein